MGTNNALSFKTGDKGLIFFDGVCNLCNGVVNFILKRDLKERFLFASLQSDAAAQVLKTDSYRADDLSSIIVISKNGKLLSRSDAALYIARHLPGGWRLLYIFKIIPRFIRDGVYNFIAKHRYRFFGKQEKCTIPTPENQQRFLETI